MLHAIKQNEMIVQLGIYHNFTKMAQKSNYTEALY